MKTYSIGLDIDQCILDTTGTFLRRLNKVRDTHYKFEEMWAYDLNKVYDVPVPMIIDMFKYIDDRKTALLDPNCPKVIDNLRDEGFEIVLVTAHIPHAIYGQGDLIEALDNYKINYDRINFVDVHDHGVKGELAPNFDYMLDDAPHHIEAIGDFTKAILYEMPYSINIEVPKAWKRVQTWSRLEKIILEDIR